MVAEQHLGKLLQCGHCARTFTTRADPASGSMVGPVRLEIGAATSAGRVRPQNEDSFLVQHLVWSNLDDRQELAVLVVADGMGGAAAGDRASGLTIRTVAATLAPLVNGALNGSYKDAGAAKAAEAVAAALRTANRTVYQMAQVDPAYKGMGATAAVVLAWNGQIVIGHAGDCRVYHQRGGKLTQVTRDQTLVARMVELGKLTPKEALRHPARNEVTHAVGKAAELDPAAYQLVLAPGDWLVIACDGLHAHLDGDALQEEIRKAPTVAVSLAQ
jgi:serine/threonine protein phosphatase PrpC